MCAPTRRNGYPGTSPTPYPNEPPFGPSAGGSKSIVGFWEALKGLRNRWAAPTFEQLVVLDALGVPISTAPAVSVSAKSEFGAAQLYERPVAGSSWLV